MESLPSHQVDAAAELFREKILGRGHINEAESRTGGDIDQDVDVTVSARRSADDRTKQGC